MNPLDDVRKFEELTVNQWFAVGNKLGGLDAVKSVLRGDKLVVLRDRPEALFDKNGRRILPKGFLSAVQDPDKKYYFGQVDRERLFEGVFQAERLARLYTSFPFPQYLFNEASRVWRALKDHLAGHQIMNGLCLPILIPEWCAGPGKDLPGHKDLICRESGLDCLSRTIRSLSKALSGKLETASFFRHEVTFSKLGWRKGGLHHGKSLIALFFPEALWGYSVNAALEQMETLPPGFFLAGIYETCSAYAMYPDILALDSAPGLDAPGNFHGDVESSTALFIKRGENLYLSMCLGRNHRANADISSGLIYFQEL